MGKKYHSLEDSLKEHGIETHWDKTPSKEIYNDLHGITLSKKIIFWIILIVGIGIGIFIKSLKY